MANIGFIGTGEIAQAMIHALAGRGHHLRISQRSHARSTRLAAQYADVEVLDNATVVAHSEVVIVALMNNVAHNVLPPLTFTAQQKIISVMVDLSHNQLQTLCAPASDISITIPLPFIATGGCPLPVFPDTGSVRELFGAANPILPVQSEQALNAHFAATAMASVTLAQMQTVSNWLSEQINDPSSAEQYVISMLAGYTKQLPLDGENQIAQALTALSTEGGLNATLRQHMDDAGTQTALTTGLDSFKQRLGLL